MKKYVVDLQSFSVEAENLAEAKKRAVDCIINSTLDYVFIEAVQEDIWGPE